MAAPEERSLLRRLLRERWFLLLLCGVGFVVIGLVTWLTSTNAG